MKSYLFLPILCFSLLFSVNLKAEKPADSITTNKRSSDVAISYPQMDSIQVQEYLRQYKDSLQLDRFKLPKFDKDYKFRFNQPNDSTRMRRYFNPPQNKHPNPNFRAQKNNGTKPYVTHVGPDNMPVYVPEDGYIPNMKVEKGGNMPVKVPEGFEKKELSTPKK